MEWEFEHFGKSPEKINVGANFEKYLWPTASDLLKI